MISPMDDHDVLHHKLCSQSISNHKSVAKYRTSLVTVTKIDRVGRNEQNRQWATSCDLPPVNVKIQALLVWVCWRITIQDLWLHRWTRMWFSGWWKSFQSVDRTLQRWCSHCWNLLLPTSLPSPWVGTHAMVGRCDYSQSVWEWGASDYRSIWSDGTAAQFVPFFDNRTLCGGRVRCKESAAAKLSFPPQHCYLFIIWRGCKSITETSYCLYLFCHVNNSSLLLGT